MQKYIFLHLRLKIFYVKNTNRSTAKESLPPPCSFLGGLALSNNKGKQREVGVYVVTFHLVQNIPKLGATGKMGA